MRAGFDFYVNVGSRKIYYAFQEAKNKNKPILIVLHGHGHHERPASFRSEDWNVICPLDCFGVEGKGTWYLGESGDFFWFEAIRLIIEKVRKEVGNGQLYFWGSSMGGYGALLHGYLNNAAGVYSNIPQTVLLGSRYSDGGAFEYFEGIFGSEVNKYNDLKDIILDKNNTLFFLCFNQLERDGYFSEQGLGFIDHLNSIGQKMYVEIRPISTHGVNHKIWETIELFKNYDASIDPDAWKIKVEAKREGGFVKSTCIVNERHFPNGVEYAFYLMANGERVDVRWYTEEADVVLKIPEGLVCKSLKVQSYVRDRGDNNRKILEIARIKC